MRAELVDVGVELLADFDGPEGVAVPDPKTVDVLVDGLVVELLKAVPFIAAQIFAGIAPKALGVNKVD
jgi:hypothetical protein